MAIVIDKIFGKMEYKHSWTKKDSFIFLDKAYVVNITAQAYKGDNILESQQISYSKHKEFLEKHKLEIEKKLTNFCEELYKAEGSPDKYLIPKTIIFERDGSWGILFETDYDIENGIAVFIIDNKIMVNIQSVFL